MAHQQTDHCHPLSVQCLAASVHIALWAEMLARNVAPTAWCTKSTTLNNHLAEYPMAIRQHHDKTRLFNKLDRHTRSLQCITKLTLAWTSSNIQSVGSSFSIFSHSAFTIDSSRAERTPFCYDITNIPLWLNNRKSPIKQRWCSLVFSTLSAEQNKAWPHLIAEILFKYIGCQLLEGIEVSVVTFRLWNEVRWNMLHGGHTVGLQLQHRQLNTSTDCFHIRAHYISTAQKKCYAFVSYNTSTFK